MKSPFTIIDHPADIGIEARGMTLTEAFENVANGLMSIIVERATVAEKKEEYIQVHAADREQLLVRWLNEILYMFDGQHFVPKTFSITEISDTFLKAKILGDHFSPSTHRTKLDVKAITYHQLSIKNEADGLVVTVFVDI